MRNWCVQKVVALSFITTLWPMAALPIVFFTTDNVGEYLESITRRKLARAGIRSQPQVNVLDERRIDLVIGDRLALECDGKGKNEMGATVDSDRRRDAFLEALGFHVIHLSYAMVLHDWEATLSMIVSLIERGDHLDRSRFRTYLTPMA